MPKADDANAPPPPSSKRFTPATWALLAIALVALGWLAWDQWFKDQYVPRNFGVVEQGQIYRAGRLSPAVLRRLDEDHHFKTIIDFGAYEPDSPADRAEQRTAEALGITRYRFQLEGDATGNPNAYVAALRVMTDPDNHPVLVHCAAGSERTSACVIFYRTIVQNTPMDDAVAEAPRFRHDFDDNPRMMAVVAEYKDRIARALHNGGWLMDHPPVPIVPVGAHDDDTNNDPEPAGGS